MTNFLSKNRYKKHLEYKGQPLSISHTPNFQGLIKKKNPFLMKLYGRSPEHIIVYDTGL